MTTYHLSTEADLQGIDATIDGNSHTYILDNDITLTSNWTPLNGILKGEFDGQGYAIIDIVITTSGGFFGESPACYIHDLIIRNATVTHTSPTNGRSGILCGHNSNNTMDRIWIDGGSITSDGTKVGSLCGELGSNPLIPCRNVFSTATVTGTGNTSGTFAGIGGLFGIISAARVFNSYFSGTLDTSGASGTKFGGLAGMITASGGGSVAGLNDCFFNGTVSTGVKEIFGATSSSGFASNCHYNDNGNGGGPAGTMYPHNLGVEFFYFYYVTNNPLNLWDYTIWSRVNHRNDHPVLLFGATEVTENDVSYPCDVSGVIVDTEAAYDIALGVVIQGVFTQYNTTSDGFGAYTFEDVGLFEGCTIMLWINDGEHYANTVLRPSWIEDPISTADLEIDTVLIGGPIGGLGTQFDPSDFKRFNDTVGNDNLMFDTLHGAMEFKGYGLTICPKVKIQVGVTFSCYSRVTLTNYTVRIYGGMYNAGTFELNTATVDFASLITGSQFGTFACENYGTIQNGVVSLGYTSTGTDVIELLNEGTMSTITSVFSYNGKITNNDTWDASTLNLYVGSTGIPGELIINTDFSVSYFTMVTDSTLTVTATKIFEFLNLPTLGNDCTIKSSSATQCVIGNATGAAINLYDLSVENCDVSGDDINVWAGSDLGGNDTVGTPKWIFHAPLTIFGAWVIVDRNGVF